MNSKIVYVVTTVGCFACKCMENILKEIQKDNPTFAITTTDFKNCPEWLKNNVIMTDFPTVVFVSDNTIKYYFRGTMSKSKVVKLITNINF